MRGTLLRPAPCRAHGKGFVLQVHYGAGLKRGIGPGRLAGERHAPCGLAGRCADGDDGAGAAVEEGGFDASLTKDFGGTIERPTLADRTRVDFDARQQETNGMRCGLKPHMPPSDAGEGIRDGRRVWEERLAAVEAPCPEKRAHGGIESAIGGMDQPGNRGKEGEHGRLDRYGTQVRRAMDSGKRRGGQVWGKPLLDARNLFEGLLGGGAEGFGTRSVEDNFEARRHGDTSHADWEGLAVAGPGHGHGTETADAPEGDVGRRIREGQDWDTDPTREVSAASMESMRRRRWESAEPISTSAPTPLLTRAWASGVR